MNQTKQINLQNVEIEKLKAEQVVDRKTIQDNREISIKEVYERVLLLQGKFDAVSENNKSNIVRFTIFTYMIIAVEVINFILNVILWQATKFR